MLGGGFCYSKESHNNDIYVPVQYLLAPMLVGGQEELGSPQSIAGASR